MKGALFLLLVLLLRCGWAQCPPTIANPVIRVTPANLGTCSAGTVRMLGHHHVEHRMTSGSNVQVADEVFYLAALGVSDTNIHSDTNVNTTARYVALLASDTSVIDTASHVSVFGSTDTTARLCDLVQVAVSNATWLDQSFYVSVQASDTVNVTAGRLTGVFGSTDVVLEDCFQCFVVSADHARITGKGTTWPRGIFLKGEDHRLVGGDISDAFVAGDTIELTASGYGDYIRKVFVAGIEHRITLTSTSGTTYALEIAMVGGTGHQVLVGERGISACHIFGGSDHVMNTTGSPLLTGLMSGNSVFGGATHQVRTSPTAVAAPLWNTVVGGLEHVVETRGAGSVAFNVIVGGTQHAFRGSTDTGASMLKNGIFAGSDNAFEPTGVVIQTDCVILGGDQHRMHATAERNALVGGRAASMTGAADSAIVGGVNGMITTRNYGGSMNENAMVGGNANEIGLRATGNDIYRSGMVGGTANNIISPTVPAGLMQCHGMVGGAIIKIQGGSFTGTVGGQRNSVTDTSRAAMVGGSDNTIENNADGSAMVGGGRQYNGNRITNATRSVILGGQGHTIPSGIDDAVIAGGENLTATGPGLTTSDAYVTGTLYSDDVTTTAGDLTLETQDASGNVVAKMGHTWDNAPETNGTRGQFEVQDSNGYAALVVNHWGTTVLKNGVILPGGFRDVGSDTGVGPLTADRVAMGYTFYRNVSGSAGFIVKMPTADEFEQILGMSGVAAIPGTRFPPVYLINRSAVNTLGFALNTGITAVWSPSTPFTTCATSTLCKLELTIVASAPGAVTFLIAVETNTLS